MFNFLKESKDYIFFFFITLLFAYVIGLTIVSLINKRLTDISINVPPPQVNVQWPNSQPKASSIDNQDSHHEEIKENFSNIPKILVDDDLRGFNSQKEYHDCTEAVSQIQQEKLEQMNRVCMYQHDHNKYLCTYGKTNYINPSELDPINRRLFQYNYFPNMTLQDYINWLWLYKNESEKLCYEHFRNLEKLKNGQQLRYQKNICPPKINAEGSFSYAKDGTHDLGRFFTETMKHVGLN